MTLPERLSQEIKTAMVAKDAERLSTLRLFKSAIGYAQIEKKTGSLSDPEMIAIAQKEIKKRRDAIEQFTRGGRQELADQEAREISVLESFLPQPLPPAELEILVRQAIQDLGATGRKDMGAVIKAVQAKTAGRADGKSISTVVARLLP